MARNETERFRPAALTADEEASIAIQTLADYQPVKAIFSKDSLTTCHAAMRSAREVWVRAENAVAAARDNAAEAEWEFLDLVLAAKAQVVAQYGADSNAVRSLGLKKSE